MRQSHFLYFYVIFFSILIYNTPVYSGSLILDQDINLVLNEENLLDEYGVELGINYATNLYKTGEYLKALSSTEKISSHYNGKKAPYVEYLKSKCLFMAGKHKDFFKNYKHTYIKYSNFENTFVRKNEYAETLDKAIHKMIQNASNDRETVVKLYMLYEFINSENDRENSKNLHSAVEDYLSKKTTTNLSINLSGSWTNALDACNLSYMTSPRGEWSNLINEGIRNRAVERALNIYSKLLGEKFQWVNVEYSYKELKWTSTWGQGHTESHFCLSSENVRFPKDFSMEIHHIGNNQVTFKYMGATFHVEIFTDNIAFSNRNKVKFSGGKANISIDLPTHKEILSRKYGHPTSWAAIKIHSDQL